MKKITTIIYLITLIIFDSCSSNQNKNTIQFIPLSEKDFNYRADSTFAIPKGKTWNERKRIHDSCMGSSFAANAVFIRTKDTFHLGCIVNRKTMKIVKNLYPRHFIGTQFGSSVLSFITEPCYEKGPMNVSIDSFFKTKFILQLPSVRENINKELNEAIHTSIKNQVEIGSWVNAELTDALGKILDTTKNESLLDYKKYLLEPDNMILVRSTGFTDATFYFHTQKPMSAGLQNALIKKPFAALENSNLKPQLFFIDQEKFELTFTDFFQIAGQFMKCKLQ